MLDGFHTILKRKTWQRMETVRLHLECCGQEGEHFLRHIITLDETRVRCYQPKLKRQSNEWRHNDSPWPQKYWQEQDPIKVMFIVAYDFNGVLVIHSVPVESRVNGAYYSYFLEHRLRPGVRLKRPNLLNSHPIVLRDAARTHIINLINLLRR